MATYSRERKLVRCVSNNAKKIELRSNCDDRISSLPDDILVHILSLLMDIREATRTSVLSKKWQHLWYNVPNYDFTGYDFTASQNKRLLGSKLLISCVNNVVRSSRASAINRFKVHCKVDAQDWHSISEWLNFCMTKSVKELEFNFSGYSRGWLVYGQTPATLPPLWRYANYPSVHTLVSLTLGTLCITTEFLDSLLFNFTNLQHLIMKRLLCLEPGCKGYEGFNSHKKNMKIKLVGSLPKLRHLEIVYCKGLGEVEISAEKLTSLVYSGKIEDTKYSYVPLLNDVTFCSQHASSLIGIFGIIAGFSSQLSRLKLEICKLEKINQRTLEVPNQFGNLRELELAIYDYPTESLLLVTNFIDACPLLHKVKLQRWLPFLRLKSDLEKWNWKESRDDVRFVAMKHHHCLNIFEMVGFLGAKVDIELILLLAQEAIPLEKIILDPNQPCYRYELEVDNPPDLVEIGRIEAKLLRNHIPSRIQMEVL